MRQDLDSNKLGSSLRGCQGHRQAQHLSFFKTVVSVAVPALAVFTHFLAVLWARSTPGDGGHPGSSAFALPGTLGVRSCDASLQAPALPPLPSAPTQLPGAARPATRGTPASRPLPPRRAASRSDRGRGPLAGGMAAGSSRLALPGAEPPSPSWHRRGEAPCGWERRWLCGTRRTAAGRQGGRAGGGGRACPSGHFPPSLHKRGLRLFSWLHLPAAASFLQSGVTGRPRRRLKAWNGMTSGER